MILGKPVNAWADIYCLMVWDGQEPRSLKDLMRWQPPNTPQECLELGLELLEARKKVINNPTYVWIESLLKEASP